MKTCELCNFEFNHVELGTEKCPVCYVKKIRLIPSPLDSKEILTRLPKKKKELDEVSLQCRKKRVKLIALQKELEDEVKSMGQVILEFGEARKELYRAYPFIWKVVTNNDGLYHFEYPEPLFSDDNDRKKVGIVVVESNVLTWDKLLTLVTKGRIA